MSKDLVQFDSLKADITIFVSPVKTMKVTDFKSSADAIEAGKQVKNLQKQVEDKRKALVGPLNDEVKLINSYAKDIMQPLDAAALHIGSELNKFAIEQDKIKQEELRRAEEDRRIQEEKAQQERQRMADAAEEKRLAEIAELEQAQAEAHEMFGESEDSAEVNAQLKQEIEERNERERLEAEARMDREAAIRSAQSKAVTHDINQNQIKNTRKNWKVEVVDINKVPKEFLIIQLNEKMALASARAGNTEIEGLKFTQEITVALGSAYVPKRVLERA